MVEELKKIVRQAFEIECKGRGFQGEDVLDEPVKVQVIMSQLGTSSIEVDVRCPYNTGGHGQRCKASHPEQDKIGEDGISCPYSLSIPYALEHPRRQERGR